MRTHHFPHALAFGAILCGSLAAAQNIDAYRFWYDGDIASATTTTVTAVPVLTLNTTLPASGSGKGLHVLSIQFRDSNGAWSIAVEEPFARVDDQITGYQFWFDRDLANVQNVTLTGAPVQTLSASVPTGGLTPGQHSITMRFQDGLGNWSVEQTQWFAKSGAQLTAWQYWFDDNVAALVETNAGPGGTLNVATSIDASALAAGAHEVTWRMKDALGNWSVPVVEGFDLMLGVPDLPGVDRVLLMPNPAENELVLRIDAASVQILSIEVFDATGRTIIVPASMSFSGTMARSIDVGALTPGTYHLRLTGVRGSTVLPFVKR
jgi:hypothetical protein